MKTDTQNQSVHTDESNREKMSVKEDSCDYCHQAFIMCVNPNCDEYCLGHHRDLSGFYCSDRCWCLLEGTPLDQVSDMPLATKTQQGKYEVVKA